MKYLALFLLCAASAFGQHTAAWTITSSDCNSTNTCTAQIWRVALTNTQTCPAVGNSAYVNVQSSLAGTATASGTTWNYTDTGASLANNATYCGYSTVTFTAGGGPSGASAIFQGTFPTPPPLAPTIGVRLN